MPITITALPATPSDLVGLSQRLIDSHYENNYGGALRRLNAIRAELARLDPATAPGFHINGLKREELIAANSVILHELYFAGLGAASAPPDDLAAALARDFGDVARWRTEFEAMGKALGGGSGWVVLAWSPREGRLVNQWAADHTHVLADSRPILALDMYEHAYHLDYGARAGAYVEAFLRNIAWAKVAERWRRAAADTPLHGNAGEPDAVIAPEALRDALAAGQAPLLLDVRRRPAFDAGSDVIVGATWRAPERVGDWIGALPGDTDIVVYCVYGHNVSQDTVAALRAKGLRARALAGGIAAWRAIGAPTAPKTNIGG
jgi:Fe-Mn family superoxide dismutase